MRRIVLLFIPFVILATYMSCGDDIDKKPPIIEYPPIDTTFQTNPNDTLNTEGAVVIVFDKNTAIVTNPYEGQGVSIIQNGADVVIHSTTIDEIIYILRGSTTDGSLKIYSDIRYELKMNGVDIIKTDDPALNIQSTKRALITLVEGTSNRLVGGMGFVSESGAEDVKAAFFSEGQLVFDGTGCLTVISRYRHAICSDHYVRIDGGTIIIPIAATDGIHANDYIEVNDGTVDITSMSDGMEAEKGHIHLNGGTIKIVTTGKKGHGIKSATGTIVRMSGDLEIEVQGEASKAFNCRGDMYISQGNINLTTLGDAFYDTEESDISSPAGIKCDGDLTIDGGRIVINSTGVGGKGINGNGMVTINDGEISIATTGDQFNYRNDNTKAKAVNSENLTINGGSIYASSMTDVALGTKGALTVAGGIVVGVAHGAVKKGFDGAKTFKIIGGTLVGIGGASGSPMSNISKQYAVNYAGSITKNAFFHVSSSAGKAIMTYQLPYTLSKAFVMFSNHDLELNTNYTISTGGAVTGGTSFHGLYDGATYTGGTSLATFVVSSMVTDVNN